MDRAVQHVGAAGGGLLGDLLEATFPERVWRQW